MLVTLRQSRFSRTLLLVFGIAFLVGIFAFLPADVLAQTDNLEAVGEESGLSTEGLATIIGRIISVFLSVLGIVLLGIVIYAGYLWMTAGGDPDKKKKTKKKKN